MMRKAIILVLLAGMLIFATNAFALNAGDPFSFYNVKNPIVGNTWTHTLTNADFLPALSGSEPLIIKSAVLAIAFTFTPAMQLPGFYLAVLTPSIDGFYTGSTFTYASTTPGPFVKAWTHKITEPLALQAIADKSALIKLTANVGKLDEVHFSFIGGSGVVAPEPITMALVGAGMAGLPFAGRFRRFIKRRK